MGEHINTTTIPIEGFDNRYDDQPEVFDDTLSWEAPDDPETYAAYIRQQTIIANYIEKCHDPLLKPHQLDATEGLRELLQTQSDVTRPYILLHPPGAGKTVWAASTAKALGVGQNLGLDRPVRALFVSSERRILTQTVGEETVTAKGFSLAAPDIATSEYSSDVRDNTGDVVLMTYDMMRSEMGKPPEARGINFDTYDVIFFDECQSALGPETLPLVQTLQQNRLTIGLTGTPELEDGRNACEVWPNVIHHIGLAEGIEGIGILNSVVVYTLHTGEEISSNGDSDDFTPQELAPLSANKQIFDYTVRLAHLLAAHNAKTVVFGFPGDESNFARKLAEALNGQEVTDRAKQSQRTIKAEAIGSFRKDGNQQIFDDFDNGEIDIITSVKLGEVGWDPVNVNCVILACPTRSARALIQRIGRGLRLQDSPTILIHFDYELTDTSRGEIKTPYMVLEKEPAQGVVVANPNDNLARGLGDIARILREIDKSRNKVYRGRLERRAAFTEIMAGIDEITKEAEAAMKIKRRRAYRRNQEGMTPEGHFDLQEVSALSGVSAEQLKRALRLSSHQAYSLSVRGERRSFCTAEALAFLEERMAKPGELSIAGIAETFDCSSSVVASTARRMGLFDKRHLAIRRDDLPHRGQLEINVFSATDTKKILAELHDLARPVFAHETPISDVVDATGRSRQTIVDYLATNYGLMPTQRRVNEKGRSGTLCMPKALAARIIDELNGIQALPDDYKDTYIIMNEVRHIGTAKRHGVGPEEVEALIDELGITRHLFNRSNGHRSEFIKKSDLHLLRNAIKSQTAEGISQKHGLPLSAIIEIAGVVALKDREDTTSVEERIQKLTTDAWRNVDTAIEEVATELNVQQPGSSAERQLVAERVIARMVLSREPLLKKIVEEDTAKRANAITMEAMQQQVTAQEVERQKQASRPDSVRQVAASLGLSEQSLLKLMKSACPPSAKDIRSVPQIQGNSMLLSASYRSKLAHYVAMQRERGLLA